MPDISEEELQSLNDAKTQLTEITKVTDGLKGDIDTLKTAKVELERKLDDADKELLSEDYLDYKGKDKNKGGGGNSEEDDGTFDFDRASGKEIAAHLSGKSKKELEAAIKGVTDRIGKTEEHMGKAFAQLDVTLAAIRHSDFDANKDAIYAVAKSNPTWGAEKCYTQWQMENKKAIDVKAEEEKKKAEEERKLLAEKGEGVPNSTTQDKQLSSIDAAGVAYDKAFGNTEKT